MVLESYYATNLQALGVVIVNKHFFAPHRYSAIIATASKLMM